ncbi:hypothetical protein QJS04_geneDACA023720 [Acorus gramineus]|uniref:Jacalin-type lectin domain-containing protein n=1 Tax=Acorus gramineus TaxID=55184 RepID=A0AAV9A0N5_ACOGR|nr:hypothetical protein QJS04_geneDACA023720 [Acorus gramineus]
MSIGVGQFGGNGGDAFDYSNSNAVTEVIVRSGAAIDSIIFKYYHDGIISWSPNLQGEGGSPHQVLRLLDSSEDQGGCLMRSVFTCELVEIMRPNILCVRRDCEALPPQIYASAFEGIASYTEDEISTLRNEWCNMMECV